MASPPVPAATEQGKPWPKISVVTPNFNYGTWLEETIRSVLLQGYPNLEYIVIDGQSRDESVDVIRRYQNWLTYWVSEPDSGQANAINKGFGKVTGDVCNWLNSDDILMPGALRFVGEVMAAGEFDWVAGGRVLKSPDGVALELQTPWLTQWPQFVLGAPDFPQESTFFSRRLWETVGGVDEGLECLFDVAFFARALRASQRGVLTRFAIGAMNSHALQKTLARRDVGAREYLRVRNEIYSGPLRRVVERLTYSRFWPLVDAGLRLGLRPLARRYQIAFIDPMTNRLRLQRWEGV